MRIRFVAFLSAALAASGAAAATCSNPICLENQLPGTPQSQWDITANSTNIAGFTTDISVNHGQTVYFKVQTSSNNWKIDIYRLGYYQGNGARLITTINVHQAQNQPAPLQDTATGLFDAGNWAVSASWAIPATAVSGVYLAKLTDLNNTNNKNQIPFIVRADESQSDIVFKTSDTTWHAYNGWFGNNLYGGSGPGVGGRAYKVSYNRPFGTRFGVGQYAAPYDFVLDAEFDAIFWLEQNGYDVSYIASVDPERSPALLKHHKVYTSTGHDEYWSGGERAAVEQARAAGVSLIFMSGNEVFWKTRWEPSIDSSHTAYRTLVCYKETRNNAPLDPLDSNPNWTWTGSWRDPRFSPPADGSRPENALTGTIFSVDSYRTDAIQVPYPMSTLRFWRNTPNVSKIGSGQTWTLASGLLGYEWDSSPDNGFAPPGLIYLSSATLNVNTYLRDYGLTDGNGTATHNLALYKDPASGAIVFGAGTVFWAYGLATVQDGTPDALDPNVQQAMVNLLADMGVQPGTLQTGLVAAVKSTDTAPPASVISAPANGASFVTGQPVTISGGASDIGGQVAGVEVSVDGGTTWHRASGTASWTYTWVPVLPGSYTIKSRATDDSLNTQTTPTTGPTISVTALGSSLFPSTNIPEIQTSDDPNSVELGVKFFATQNGFINGLRFYKNMINVGPHTGELWTASGTRLASVTFANESATGWQQANFASPVAINANTTYIISFHTNGFYSSIGNYFANAVTTGSLTAPSNGASGGNGVFAYGSGIIFPNSSASGTNYWVDVVFAPATGPQPPVCSNASGFITAQNTPLSIPASALVSNCFSPSGYTLSLASVGNPTHGTVAFDGVSTVTFTPASNYLGSASFDFTVSDGHGGTASATASLFVQASGASSLFSPSDAPAVVTVNDPSPVELGVKFSASKGGQITGIQFYKGPQNTGTHTGELWSATGTLLASATFTSESPSGWQAVTFANPVSITAGKTYVASYHSNGFYSATGNYFGSAHSNGFLTAPDSASSGGNGVYSYGSSTVFPSSSYNATNYWVDVIFTPASSNAPPACSNASGFLTAANTPLSIPASALLANCSSPNVYPLSLTGVSSPTNGTVTFDGANAVTFTPASNYTGGASFVFSISDGHGGTASATASLMVRAAGASTLFSASDAPAIVTVNDASSVELGVKFTASRAGQITGIQFYKGPQNTGTHTAHLWDSGGNLLASATFANETDSGWQAAAFASPVAIAAGATYIASYHTSGFYSASGNYFATAHTSGPLTAPDNASSGGNGVYAYGTNLNPATPPTSSFNATNYWIDVSFQ